MPHGAAPLAEVPVVLGVNGLGRSALERHGVVQVSGSGPARIATLTVRGIHVRDAYAPVVAHVTREWCERYGKETVDHLVDALRTVDATAAGDRPDHVLVRFAGPTPVDVSSSSAG
jgi:hypothetical protein